MTSLRGLLKEYPCLVNERFCARCGYEYWKCQSEGYIDCCKDKGLMFVNPTEVLKGEINS